MNYNACIGYQQTSENMFGKQKFQTVSSPIADRFTKACGQPILNGASAQTMLPLEA